MSNCPCCSASVDSFFRVGDLTLAKCGSCHLVFQPEPGLDAGLYQNPRYYAHWGLSREFSTVWRMKSQSSMDYLKLARRFSELPDGASPRLLDVGCAYGYVLEAGRALGFESYGVEVSPAADFAASRGLKVFRGQLSDATFPNDYFDLVTIVDVIEHIAEPLRLLGETYRILKPGGWVLILTPNVDSVAAKFLGRRWPHYKEEHVCYYCPHSITHLLERTGFETSQVSRGFKRLNYKYVIGHFGKFSKDWWVTYLVLKLGTLIPNRVTMANVKLPTEMLALAKKPGR